MRFIAAFLLLVLAELTYSEPLRILLTNDDGFDSPGIQAVHDSLVAAGHEVILVAPLGNQSSSGMRVITHGKLDYQEHAPGVWPVDGSPADAVLVALLHIMKEDAPVYGRKTEPCGLRRLDQ